MKPKPFSKRSACEKQTSLAVRRKFFAAHFRDHTGLGRSREDAVLFFLVAAMFVDWILSTLVTLIVAVWVLASKKRLVSALRPRVSSLCILGLIGVFSLVSLCLKNYLSALAFVGIALYCLVVLWVRSFMTRRRYERMLDLSISLSFFSAALAFLQKFVLHAGEWSSYVVKGPTNNANYYGLQLSMVILAALFRLFQTGGRQRVYFYLSSLLVNFIMLIFSESMASIAGLVVGILLLVFVYRCYKTFAGILAVLTSAFTLGFFVPGAPWNGSILFPILERMALWKIAWESICENAQNFLFGQGLFSFQALFDVAPHGFWDVRGMVPRDFQPHCHNLFLEIWLSVGLLGLLFLAVYAASQILVILRKNRDASLRPYGVFFLIVLISVFVCNLADASLFWMQSGLWFLLASCCSGISPSETADSVS